MNEKLYAQIIQDLQAEKRPHIDLSSEELNQVLDQFNHLIKLDSLEQKPEHYLALKNLLCIINHLKKPNDRFNLPIIHALKNHQLPDEIKVFLLQSVQKHIIDYKTVTGKRLSYEFLESLKEFFNHSNNELTFWVLNIIDDIGGQSVYFKEVINAKKWRLWDAFSQQNQASIQMINKLNEKWKNLSLPTK